MRHATPGARLGLFFSHFVAFRPSTRNVSRAELTRDTWGLTYHGVTQTTDPKGREGQDDGETPDVKWEPAPSDPATEKDKKERVLHTRVPALLERELKRFAENLRVPVSNLVRTILEDAVNAADLATETVEQRLRKAAGTIENERVRIKNRLTPDPLAGVFAFQAVKLARAQQCAKCERSLAAGESAQLGLSDDPKAPRLFVCDGCLPSPTPA